MMETRREGSTHIDVPTRHVDEVLRALRAAGWSARDSGRTVATDDGDEALTTILVEFSPSREPVHEAPRAAARPRSDVAAPPVVRGGLFARGDFFIGDGVEMEGPLTVAGNLLVGRHATVSGSVRASGDIVLEDHAVVGDATCFGTLVLKEGARVTGTIEAARGMMVARPREPASSGEPARGALDSGPGSRAAAPAAGPPSGSPGDALWWTHPSREL